MAVWNYEKSTERKDSTGGTSKRSVLEQADKLEAWVSAADEGSASGSDGGSAKKKQKK